MKNKLLTGCLILLVMLSLNLRAADWQSANKMHTPRGGASAVKWGRYIYVLGGKAKNNKVLKTVERYDILTDTWEKNVVPNFSKPRYNAGAIVYRNKIYLVGGRDGSSALKDVEVYDPVQNSWSEAQDLHEEREGLSVHILGGKLYAIGGREDYYSMVKDIEWYDIPEDKWKEASWEMENPRADFFSAVHNDTLYQFGGYYYGLTRMSYRAVPSQGGYSWHNMHKMNSGRAYGVTLKIGEKIYLIGGEISNGKSKLVEVYDAYNESFSSEKPLTTPRSGLTGVVAGDTLFVIGGFEGNDDTPVATVEYMVLNASPIENDPAPQYQSTHLIVQGYPNPFNGRVAFQIRIPRSGIYKLEIFDVSGRLVKTLFNGHLSTGTQYFSWDARDNHLQIVASGVYFFIIRSGREIQKLKLIYVR